MCLWNFSFLLGYSFWHILLVSSMCRFAGFLFVPIRDFLRDFCCFFYSFLYAVLCRDFPWYC